MKEALRHSKKVTGTAIGNTSNHRGTPTIVRHASLTVVRRGSPTVGIQVRVCRHSRGLLKNLCVADRNVMADRQV